MKNFNLPSNIEAVPLLKFIRTMDGQLVVPIYQREYKWTKNKSVKIWWLDIKKLFDKSDAHHFAGFIIYNIQPKTYDQNDLLIIDGQQRLTTMFLILKCMLDLVKDNKDKEDFKFRYLFKREKGEIKLRLKETNQNDGIFSKIMNDKKLNEDEHNSNIYRVFEFLHYEIMKYSNQSIESLMEALERLYVIEIPLDYSHEPQKIFESINSKGEGLKSVDLIRNYILMGLKANEQHEFYKNYWLKFERLINPVDREKFWLNFMRLKMKDLFWNTDLYSKFKEYYDSISNNNEKLKHFSDELLEYSQLFKDLYEPNDNKDLVIKDFSELPLSVYCSSIAMLLLKMYKHKQIKKELLDKIFILLNTYFIRREICDIDYDLSQILVPLIDKIEENKSDLYDFLLFKIVNANIDNKGRMPDDNEVKEKIHNSNAYKHKKGYTSVIFRNIEESQSSAKKTQLMKSLTIEHIMPKKPKQNSNYWNYFKSTNDNEFKKYLNKIGNLTLLTRVDNNLAGNSEYTKKLDFFTYKDLKMNKLLFETDNWNPEEIDKRTDWLCNKCIEWFPYQKSLKEFSNTYDIYCKVKDIEYYALYDEDARSVTVKKDTRVYNYSNDEENENFPLFIELCENGVIKKYEDNNYYFTNDYTFMPSKFGSNNTAKSSSINFLTNSSYNGKNKWQKLKD